MGWDQGIANRLRAAGLAVVEVDGWQTRGSSSFTPGGSVCHHTAGGASGTIPSLNTLIYGRPDLAGPLCNVAQSREADPTRDKAYVIAAGRANHAGEGGWKGLSGNSSVYGLEIEHTGVEPLPEARQQVAARIHAAMFSGDPSMVCQHREWTTRKIDTAENVDPNRFRQMVAEARKPQPKPIEEDPEMLIVHPTSSSSYYLLAPPALCYLPTNADRSEAIEAGLKQWNVSDREWAILCEAYHQVT